MTTISVSVLILMPSMAAAGGSWIDFHEPLIVGSLVTGTGTFSSGQQEQVDAGPWFAMLRPETPGAEAILLGPVEIRRVSKYGSRATMSFIVPSVPTGEYWIDVVNAEGEGVGDLIGAFGVISRTPLEGRLWSRLRSVEAERARSRRAVEALRSRQAQLEAIAGDRQATIERQAERLTAAGARIIELQTDLDATAPSPAWPLWLAGAIALFVAFVGFALGRRYATRTLVTGASRSWAENQDAPASAEPNTSPLVAPK